MNITVEVNDDEIWAAVSSEMDTYSFSDNHYFAGEVDGVIEMYFGDHFTGWLSDAIDDYIPTNLRDYDELGDEIGRLSGQLHKLQAQVDVLFDKHNELVDRQWRNRVYYFFYDLKRKFDGIKGKILGR